MLRFTLVLSLVALAVAHANPPPPAPQSLAPTPPLGFNSFDSYLTYLSEDKASALIDVMAEKYLPFGYRYFVIDAGWARNVELYPGSMYPKRRLDVSMDEYGLPEPCRMYFPGGMKPLADNAHRKGLKFGLWFIRGIPRAAVERNLPIKGTPYFARDIADTTSVCGWNQDNYGIDMSRPGAQAYYNALIDKLASWGVDFVKADDIVPNPAEILAVANAIEAGGHRMVYSLSPGDVHYPTHLPYYRHANMLRITSDIWDNAASVERGFAAWEKFQGTERPGFWPDLDMIPFGRLTVVGTSDIPDVPPDRRARQSRLTPDQMRTFITQRAMAASPLIIGGDMLTMDDFSYSLLTNREMLACNQNGVTGMKVHRADGIDVWATPHRSDPLKGWIGIFNRTTSSQSVTLGRKELGFVAFQKSYDLTAARHAVLLRSVWTDESRRLGDQATFALPAEGVLFLSFSVDP